MIIYKHVDSIKRSQRDVEASQSQDSSESLPFLDLEKQGKEWLPEHRELWLQEKDPKGAVAFSRRTQKQEQPGERESGTGSNPTRYPALLFPSLHCLLVTE